MSRTPEQIEAELDKVRAELTQDVSDLTQLLSPSRLGETVKETVKSAGRSAWQDSKERTLAVVEKVKSGDRESVAAAAVGLSLVAGLALLRFTRKR